MKTVQFQIVLLIGIVTISGNVFSQTTDPIGQQAAALEAELGKYRDASGEAADILAKLVDLYHADGRLFGLVRSGQKFVISHPSDPRHKSIMLRLIDGQEALSRNKELGSTIRDEFAER